MNVKKILRTLVAATSAVALAAPAMAATVDFNLYGASAQWTFWNALAPSFLQSLGCTVDGALYPAKDSSGAYGITVGTNCSGVNGGDTVNFRYTSKASYDGILAVAGNGTNPNFEGDCGTTPTDNLYMRKAASLTGQSGKTISQFECLPVHVGASDVAGETFTQASQGTRLGPLGGADTIRSFNKIPTTGLTPYNPIIVPFGFFANNGILVKTCTSGINKGSLCSVVGSDNASCGPVNPPSDNTAGTCAEGQLANISREMAVQIFSGTANYWTDFGKAFRVDPVDGADNVMVACFRHAGSGTAASLDKAVMFGSKWGAGLATGEQTDSNGLGGSANGGAYIFFNNGSGDEVKCVNGNSLENVGPFGVTDNTYLNGRRMGAIGYADADQAVGVANTSQYIHALTYNGVPGRRTTVRNGQYDFFSNQWLYEKQARTGATGTIHNLIVALDAYAANPANLTTSGSLGAKAYYWITKKEMRWNKTSDALYPTFATPALPQTP